MNTEKCEFCKRGWIADCHGMHNGIFDGWPRSYRCEAILNRPVETSEAATGRVNTVELVPPNSCLSKKG